MLKYMEDGKLAELAEVAVDLRCRDGTRDVETVIIGHAEAQYDMVVNWDVPL